MSAAHRRRPASARILDPRPASRAAPRRSAIVRRMPSNRRAAAAAALLALAVFAALATPRAQTGPYDLLIRNGRIVDGTGAPSYRGDLAIRGETIARVAARIDAQAARVIDAEGKVVAPGFIDLHTH